MGRLETARLVARSLVRVEKQTPSQGILEYSAATARYAEASQYFHESPIVDPLNTSSIASHRHHINNMRKGEGVISRGVVMGTDLVLLSFVRLRLRNEAMSKGTPQDRPTDPDVVRDEMAEGSSASFNWQNPS